jgi:uncharacterized protein with PQ loop repeat
MRSIQLAAVFSYGMGALALLYLSPIGIQLSPAEDRSLMSALMLVPFFFLVLSGLFVIYHVAHIRDRKTKEREVKMFDRMILFVGIAGPLAAIPQIFTIWVTKTAAGVSILSWSIFLAFAFIWLCYGILHKSKPLTINSSLWVVMEIIIIFGAIMHR